MSKLAVITGDTGGLGQRLVLDFLLDGWKVVGVSRSEIGLEQTEGYEHICWDIQENPEELIAHIVEKYGVPDTFINNAAIFLNRTLAQTSDEQYEAIMRTNTTTPLKFLRALHPYYVQEGLFKNAQQNRSILNVSSAAMYPYIVNQDKRAIGAYAISKAALSMFTVVAAKEEIELGVRVNAVAPTFFTNNIKKTAAISQKCLALAKGIDNGSVISYEDASLN